MTYEDFVLGREHLAGKVKELKQDSDVNSGELTEEGAKSQLIFGGRGGWGSS